MVKNVFDGHVEVLKLGHLLLVSAAQNFFCEPKIAYRFRLGSSCLSLEVFKTVQSKALFRENQMVSLHVLAFKGDKIVLPFWESHV